MSCGNSIWTYSWFIGDDSYVFIISWSLGFRIFLAQVGADPEASQGALKTIKN